jgi:hypothetical protein
MIKEKIMDSRTPYKYIVIIKNGLDWRLFGNFEIMCEFMGLDPKILQSHLKKRPVYTAYEFTVFKVQEESMIRNRGYHS